MTRVRVSPDLLLAHHEGDLTPPKTCEALLFDWDGTLADSTSANYASLHRALTGTGTALTRDWFDRRTGLSTREMVSLLAAEQRLDLDTDSVVALRDRAYLGLLSQVRVVRPLAALARREHGRRRTAVASGSGARTLHPTIDALGLRPLFDTIVTREDAQRGKPAPDIFLEALHRLKVPAARALVYEDSDEGVEAALRAGVSVVDVRPLTGRGHLVPPAPGAGAASPR